MSARGGSRRGAGRKKGSATRRTQEIVAKATAEGITPLEVMLGAMREAWSNDNKLAAATFAEKAAPYVHPRLAAVEHSGNDEKPVAFNIVTGVPIDDAEDADGHVNGHSH